MVSATDHMTYIHERVNPVLEALVTAVLLERPDDPVNFMIRWLTEQAPDKTNTPEEIDQIRTEIERLKAKQKELQEQLGCTDNEKGPSGSGTDKPRDAIQETEEAQEDEEEEEEDDDDYVDELPPPESYKKGPRTSVSAEAYGEWNKKEEFIPPVIEKSAEQEKIIYEKINSSFMFCNLNDKEKKIVVDAVKIVTVEVGERIIQEGDEGNCLYVIQDGVFDFYKVIGGEEKLVKTSCAGEAFGELALLYNCPRAASVQCKEASVLLELDRQTFNSIVKDASMKKREMYESFLKSVEILKSLNPFEIGQLADALRVLEFNDGDYVIKEGDIGHDFFIVEEGIAKVTKNVDGEEQDVNSHNSGEFFGELALLNDAPRAASITASGTLKCVSIDRKTFSGLLGPLSGLMQRDY